MRAECVRCKGSRKLVGCRQPGLGRRNRACDPSRLEKGRPWPGLAAVSVLLASRDGLKGGCPLI